MPGATRRSGGGIFRATATLLDTEQPLFAIRRRGETSDSVGDPDQDIHAMVQLYYIDRIKTVQTDGPYFLMGHSFGRGAVVFDEWLSGS